MSPAQPIEPITAGDGALRMALQDAAITPLLAALAQVTGDLSLLRDELRPDPATIRMPDAGLTPEQQAAGRDLALEALVRWRDDPRPVPEPGPDELRRIMEFTVGGDTEMHEYLPLLTEELAVDGADQRAPDWHKDTVAPDRPFVVAVIGAGMSGILAAHRLRQAGVDHVVLEKNDDVGGTWLENTYPGCRVDVPNELYSYSFARRDWPTHFSTQPVLLDYFRACVDELGVRDSIRFGTEVTSATFDDDRATWTLQLTTPDGGDGALEAHAVVSAVGQLNRPSFPRIDGIDRFDGPSFHSARWDHDLDLTGKRVAVIGTGASAAQFIPIVADQAGELTVFQRTANWLVPTPEYHEEVPAGQRWLLANVAFYARWYRFWLFWRSAEGLLSAARVDPSWSPRDRSVGPENDELRALLTFVLEAEFADAPDLLAEVVPDYPPAAKRVVRDNGVWARTLKQDHVHLVTEPIAEITASGVATTDGAQHEADVIIYGTGFQASRFLTPMRVVGRDGVDLHEQWDGNARAYLGLTVPNFPNFFLAYGPNTNIVVNGSIIFFSECEVRYVLDCLRLLLERGCQAMDCRQDVHDAYNLRVDEGNLQMAWGASSVNSWYKNDKGRVAQNWPFTLLEYWRSTRSPDPADYHIW